ncbi:MAG: TIGR00266 family protein [Pyrinomonadaceae bacterium]|nr:TIGR00266 family protein [Pyrinomonadaceae bacterium]
MNCPKCKATIAADAPFCGSCGFQLDYSVDAPRANVAPKPPTANPRPTPPPTFNQSTSQPPPRQPVNQPPPNQSANQFSGQNQSSGQNYNQQNFGGQGTSGGAFRVDADGRGAGRGYTWEILHAGAFALAVVNLQTEQSISAEAGAMVSMSGNVELISQMKGGVFGALKRAVGGESAFVSTFTAHGSPGEVTLAPAAPGDIAGIEMNNQTFFVQASSYLAGDTSLNVETKFGGLKSWIGGEGLFLLQVQGNGLLLLSSFGAIHRKTLKPGESYVVDTGHLVAWEAQMQYQLRKAARSFFRSFLSGEGYVAEFQGPGEILIQTRNLEAFAGLLKPFFPSQSGSGGGGGFNFNLGG